MIDESTTPVADTDTLQKRTLVMAVLAPFGVMALLATPLLVDAVRHVAGG